MPYLGGSGPGGSGSAYARPAPPPPPPRAPVPRAPGQSGQVYTPPAPPPVARPLGQSHEVYTPPPSRPSLGAAVGRAVSRTATAVSHPLVQASSRTTQRLAMALASRGGRQPIPTQSTAAQDATLLKQAQTDWRTMQAKGLIPPGRSMPRIVFDQPGNSLGAFGAFMAPDKSVHVLPGVGAAASNPRSPLYAFARWLPIHEMAHTLQNQDALNIDSGLREGGAQAFTDLAAPRVLPPGVGFPGNGNYSGYVEQQFRREPMNWITRGQFSPQQPAPAVNMPGAGAFDYAMGNVGQLAGDVTRFAGIKPTLRRRIGQMR